MPRGLGIGQRVTSLGLLQAIGAYREKAGGDVELRCGVATIKLGLLRGLRSLGLPLYEITAREDAADGRNHLGRAPVGLHRGIGV